MFEKMKELFKAMFEFPPTELPDKVMSASGRLDQGHKELKETIKEIKRDHDPLDVLTRAMRRRDNE